MLLLGTAGYSYDDWEGVFYPPGLAASERLAYYAREFDIIEVNATYYRMPDQHFLQSMQQKTPPGFPLIIKANRCITHQLQRDGKKGLRPVPRKDEDGTGRDVQLVFDAYRSPVVDDDPIQEFNTALGPLRESGQLGGVLLQFPYAFKNTPSGRRYLESLAQDLGARLFVEFRHRSWITDTVFTLLKRWGLGFVCVDQPALKGLLPPLAVATAEWGYVRFHGRNASRWWKHDKPHERYDYSYTREELLEWVERVRQLEAETEMVVISFNNHYQAQSVRNARMFRELLAP